MNHLQSLPELGIGLGFRRQLSDSIFAAQDQIDWLEIISENYLGIGGAARISLERAIQQYQLLPHGVNLSIGGVDPINYRYLELLKKLITDTKCPWVSDHLCFSSNQGRYTHQLLPLPRTKETVKHVAERAKLVQEYLEVPLLLENITYYMTFGESKMTESQFLSEICEKADCGILLDLNNIVVNARNFDLDEHDFIGETNTERVVQMHIAGHKNGKQWILDTHGEPISKRVYNLLDYTLARTRPKAILLERDDNFPEFSEILSELRIIRKHCKQFKTFTRTSLDDRKKLHAVS